MMPSPPADDFPATIRRPLRLTPAFWLLTMAAAMLGDSSARILRSSLQSNLPAATALVALVTGTAVLLHLPAAARRDDCRQWRYWCAVAAASGLGTACVGIARDAFSGQASAAAIVAAASLAALLWLLLAGAGTHSRAPAFWIMVLGIFTAGAALSETVASPAAGDGAAVLALSAVTAMTAIARLGFNASRAVCCWIAYAALKPLAMAWTGLLLQPDEDSAFNSGTVLVALLLIMIVTLVVCLDARSGHHRHPDDADGSPD